MFCLSLAGHILAFKPQSNFVSDFNFTCSCYRFESCLVACCPFPCICCTHPEPSLTLQESDGTTDINDALSSREASKGLQSPEYLSSNGSSVQEPLSRRLSGGNASLFTRTSSLTSTLLQQMLSSRQPC